MKRIYVLAVTLVIALGSVTILSGCASEPYSPQLKESTVPDSALVTPGTLTVGVDASSAPYAAESNGQIIGIDVDIAAALADELGLSLTLVDVGTATADAFTEDNVDIVMGIESENAAYWTSEPYLSAGVALFAPDTSVSVPDSTGDFMIAAQSSSMSAWEVTNRYTEAHLLQEADLASAFSALGSEADYVAADSVIGAFVANNSDVTAYAIALLQAPTTQSIAVEASNSNLITAVEQALSTLVSGGVINVITQSWLGDSVDISTLEVLAAAQPAEAEAATEEGATDGAVEGTDVAAGTADSAAGATTADATAAAAAGGQTAAGTTRTTQAV